METQIADPSQRISVTKISAYYLRQAAFVSVCILCVSGPVWPHSLGLLNSCWGQSECFGNEA